MPLPPAEEEALIESHLWVVEQVVRCKRFAWGRKMLGGDADMIGEGNRWLLHAARKYTPARGAFEKFARAVIANGLSAFLRYELRERMTWASAPSTAPDDPVPELDMSQIRDNLTPREWDIVSARFGVGRPLESCGEVADRLGIHPNTVSNAVRVSLARLRTMFRPDV